jgi:hypothetical protein
MAIGEFLCDDKIGGTEDNQENQMKYTGDFMVPAWIYVKVTEGESINGMNQ